MTNSWIYQGRQYHGWFGHGKGPAKDPPGQMPGPTTDLAQRIHDIGHALVAGLPRTMRRHDAGRLSPEDHARLDRVLTAVVDALPSGLPTIAHRVFGKYADAPGLADIARAATLLRDGRGNADLRAATDALGQAAVDIGLDRFKDFLRRADEHLSGQGGLLSFVRNVPAPPTMAPQSPVGSGLPPSGLLGPFLSALFRRAGWVVLAGAAAGALLQSHHEAQIRDAIERFHFDPANAADMAAATAYVWARFNRALMLGTALPESAQDDVAEEVMRAVQSDPTLLDRAMSGDRTALDAIRAAARRVPARGPKLGFAAVTDPSDPDEQALVTSLRNQGKSASEVQIALDDHRRAKKGLSATDRRNSPDEVIMSRPLPTITDVWLDETRVGIKGAAIPWQVARVLIGRHYSTFRTFRRAFWRAVANVPELAKDFTDANIKLMRSSKAPLALEPAPDGKSRRWILHHDPQIQDGGHVYDLSNLTVVLPEQHKILHSGDAENVAQ